MEISSPNNVLFGSRRGIEAVIDFDYSVKSPFFMKDVAHAALVWSFPDGASRVDVGVFNAFIESYANNMGLDGAAFICRYDIIDWVKVSALIDAAMYFISPDFDRESGELCSYMYDKFKFFSGVGTVFEWDVL